MGLHGKEHSSTGTSTNVGGTGRAVAQQGADRLAAAYPDARCALDYSSAFQLLVATVLSAQTTDKRVNEITPELFHRWPTPAALAAASIEELEEVVRPLGMFHRRAQALQGLGERLEDAFEGTVPDTRKALVTLPGVGRKTANVVLGNWFGQDEITVDTHVGRVTRRLGWIKETDPVRAEAALWALLPDAPWTMLCHQLIYHGRQVCHSRTPACGRCPLADICPRIL